MCVCEAGHDAWTKSQHPLRRPLLSRKRKSYQVGQEDRGSEEMQTESEAAGDSESGRWQFFARRGPPGATQGCAGNG